MLVLLITRETKKDIGKKEADTTRSVEGDGEGAVTTHIRRTAGPKKSRQDEMVRCVEEE